MLYQSECLSALKSMANIHNPFEKTFMDTMKLLEAVSKVTDTASFGMMVL